MSDFFLFRYRFIKRCFTAVFVVVWLGSLGILSCTKVVEPELKGFYISNIKLRSDSDLEADIVIKIYNPNTFNIDVVLKDLRHYRDEELLGYLVREQKTVLEKMEITTLNLPIVFKKDIFIKSIFSLLLNEDVNIRIVGQVIAKHWSGDYNIDLDKTFPINIKNLTKSLFGG